MQIGTVPNLVGMQMKTILIPKFDMLLVRVYHHSIEMTYYTMSITMDQMWRCLFAMYILVGLKQPIVFMVDFQSSDELGYKG
jgi:hypothetical protein